ncbi:hypothetical protein GCM10022217_33900 [Chryseobacterium ginsenosidimutans]|uniref:hypothetical protein n=1 Tax=Chryseobacterium ginsenosidimutans TaxID=687846 RepID=UPI0031D4AAC1
MKTKLITAFLICFFANLFIAQTVVKPADIKMPSVAAFLKSKGYDIAEQTDTFVKLTNSHKSLLYMDLDTDKRYILFNVNISIITGTSKAKIDSLINEINNLAMIRVSYLESQNSLAFRYYFWVTGGYTNETLEDAVAEFFLYQGDAYGLDKDKIISYN